MSKSSLVRRLIKGAYSRTPANVKLLNVGTMSVKSAKKVHAKGSAPLVKAVEDGAIALTAIPGEASATGSRPIY
jgi:hypothetical protein